MQNGAEPYDPVPDVLFRILHTGSTTVPRTFTFTTPEGDLLPRDPGEAAMATHSNQAMLAHLERDDEHETKDPYVSFYKFHVVQGYLDTLRTEGVTDMQLIAIETSQVARTIIGAYDFALKLNRSEPDKISDPDSYSGHYMLLGGYKGESRALLMSLKLAENHYEDFMPTTETLSEQVSQHSGRTDVSAVNKLRAAFAGGYL